MNMFGGIRASVVPARRGERSCLCSGILQETKGHYGWILPDNEIDHPDALKHQGGIYLDTRDIRRGAGLCKGDQVMFYLYADSRGLGAEDCHLKPAAKTATGIPLNLADFLDLDDKKTATGKKLESEGGSDTASTASGTRSGASTPRNVEDFENDPILRMLLQPRAKETGSVTPSVASQQSSPPPAARDIPLQQDALDASNDADLFSLLRAELQEARARAGVLAKTIEDKPSEGQKARLPAGFVPPPGLEDVPLCMPNGATLPLGFTPPPGLPSPVTMEPACSQAVVEAPPGLAPPVKAAIHVEAPPGLAPVVNAPAELDAPPGLTVTEPKEKGFLGWCRRLRMSRFKEACESLL